MTRGHAGVFSQICSSVIHQQVFIVPDNGPGTEGSAEDETDKE